MSLICKKCYLVVFFGRKGLKCSKQMPDLVVSNLRDHHQGPKTAEILQIFKVHTYGVIDSKLLCEVVRRVTETLVAVKYKFSP